MKHPSTVLPSAIHVIASTVGILCGISGMEHGFFETLQGSVAPQTLLISAIGPVQRFWPGGTETALTIIPNFLVTGILAVLGGLAVIIWPAAFMQKKEAPWSSCSSRPSNSWWVGDSLKSSWYC